jgi:hypothetical protein
VACFSPSQADNTEAGICCPSARNFTVRDCFSTRPLYLCLRPRTGASSRSAVYRVRSLNPLRRFLTILCPVWLPRR